MCLQKAFNNWKNKSVSTKARWPLKKVNKFLEDGVDGKLSSSDIKALQDELLLMEVENRKRLLGREIQVGKFCVYLTESWY